MFDLNLGNLGKESKKIDTNTLYDSIIIGGGPAGITASIYLKRKGLNPAIIAKKIGGQVTDTTSVENYTGYEYITGHDLAMNFKNHADSLGVPLKEGYEVTNVSHNGTYSITTDDGEIYKTKTIIIATGSKPKHLGVPGEEKYYGRGVTYCAICDGPLFSERDVIVAGGGNSAVEAALDLSKIANSVTIVHRSELRADQILIDKINNTPNIKVHLQTQIKEIIGEKLVKKVIAYDKTKDEEIEFDVNGVFVEIGYLPNSDIFKDLVELNSRNEIVVNSINETSKEGIFAAGDVTNVSYKQIVISAGEGSKAALSVNEYLNKMK